MFAIHIDLVWETVETGFERNKSFVKNVVLEQINDGGKVLLICLFP